MCGTAIFYCQPLIGEACHVSQTRQSTRMYPLELDIGRFCASCCAQICHRSHRNFETPNLLIISVLGRSGSQGDSICEGVPNYVTACWRGIVYESIRSWWLFNLEEPSHVCRAVWQRVYNCQRSQIEDMRVNSGHMIKLAYVRLTGLEPIQDGEVVMATTILNLHVHFVYVYVLHGISRKDNLDAQVVISGMQIVV